MNSGFATEKIKRFLVQSKAVLYRHYSAPQIQIFKTLRTGFIVFFSGLVTLYIANTNIAPSLRQEILTLLGILACGIGFLVAITAYIRLVISRIVIFFTRK